jgi:hypothetical protein
MREGIEMLWMKAWMETRWRLTALAVYMLISLAANYKSNQSPAANPHGVLLFLWVLLAMCVMMLGGSGVKSQSAIGFPEGLAGSTQFTISLPVSRRRLLAVRAVFGFFEAVAATLTFAGLTWALLPSVRASINPADFARLVLMTLLFLAGPYFAAVFFTAFVDEPLALVYAGWAFVLALWLLHKAGAAVDIMSSFTRSSPVVTHSLPWPQMATSAAVALIFLWGALRVVQTHEY